MLVFCLSFLLAFTQPVEVQNDLTVKEDGETISVINREDFLIQNPGFPIIDSEQTNGWLEKIEKSIYKPAKNAYIGEDGQIVPEEAGRKLNKQAFLEKFYAYLFGQGKSTIKVPTLTVYPKVDSELLSQVRVKRIGQYVTFFNAYNLSRSHNIFLSASAIDNHVVFPNETFSFNETVGKRTIERGYLLAPIIVRGELSEGVGGGICQVSSTLFNAVDNAGLKIVERYSHSRRVPYVPPGRDATVSWYGPDFRFQNQYNQPILIRAKGYRGSVIVTLYSSEDINIEK